MKFGFVIDNRKCIGCHACTVACKAEHETPIGVNRTWVKYIEKGEFPNTRRLFSVMRCNHCTDAPCVEICPTKALFIRADGIVDFDNRRCIACKGCMQACPYDALHIDPDSHTASKCNYCAHRVEVGLEPSCVVVCPEHAIISGDMDDPESEIAQTLAREQVTARKVEKGTQPNLFYIDGDEVSLNPVLTEESDEYMWNSQATGVGHYARFAEQRVASTDPTQMVQQLSGNGESKSASHRPTQKSDDVGRGHRRVYDAPREGITWGWEVSAYIWTKAIATGAFLVPFLAIILGLATVPANVVTIAIALALFFLAVTTVLLVVDLGQPSRFLYVLLRPQWRSWLVRGGYALVIFGGFVTLFGISRRLALINIETASMWGSAIFAVIASVYTAFLFAQAKGRDFWQSPALVLHMLIHTFVGGAAVFGVLSAFVDTGASWNLFVGRVLLIGVLANALVVAAEILTPHPTQDSKLAVREIVSGRLSRLFWLGGVSLGVILPIVLLLLGGPTTVVASVAALSGLYCFNHVWVRAPQLIPLS